MNCIKCGSQIPEQGCFCPKCGTPVQKESSNAADNYVLKIREEIEELGKVIKGKEMILEKILLGIFANGNILLEDNPGTGKTTVCKALAATCDLDYNRQQCTPDTMPSDVIGYSKFDQKTGDMVIVNGSAMCNILLVDELNRTSSKTQSAFLEPMEEKTVTIDGTTRELPKPFFVIATQNPNTSMGTQLLPDSQCDRFIIKLSMGYPDRKSEKEMLQNRTLLDPTKDLRKILSKEDMIEIMNLVDQVSVHETLLDYICALVEATRSNENIKVGISPRGTIALKRMACAKAFISGRDYVTTDDVVYVFNDVCNHRIILDDSAIMNEITEQAVLEDVLKIVPQPKVGA